MKAVGFNTPRDITDPHALEDIQLARPEPGPRDKDQVNFTDPESRIMLTSSSGWQQAWNLQNSVDMNSYMILGGHVSQATNDKQQLSPALDSLESLPDSLGKTERVAADAGYYSKDNTENAISWR